jgi:hypothetical protein
MAESLLHHDHCQWRISESVLDAFKFKISSGFLIKGIIQRVTLLK